LQAVDESFQRQKGPGASSLKSIGQREEGVVAGISRRGLFKVSGAGLLEARFGGLAALLASGSAPAYAQATTVHWLRPSSFVPASDVLLKGEITRECQKALGIKLTVETINANAGQARITSAIQSGSGPDIINVVNNWV
jgi:multiple sugar transport system substrate-binding protein